MRNIDLAKITPVADTAVARLASPTAYDELARNITATMPALPGSSNGPVRPHRRPARRRSRKLMLAGASCAAATGAAALVVGLLVPGGGNGDDNPAAIQALRFVKDNGHITVIVRNPYAAASWYNADFARHHLNIRLELVPASPSFVGSIVWESDDSSSTGSEIKMINKPGTCMDVTGCTIGFTVPADFHGGTIIGIGRPARHGERYQTTAGSAFDPGEILHGLNAQVLGQPISQVLPILAARNIKIASCRQGNGACDPSRLADTWYIQFANSLAPGQITISIAPHKYTGRQP